MSAANTAFIVGWFLGFAMGFMIGIWAKGRYWHTWPTKGERKP